MRIALFHNLLSGGAKRTLAEETRRLVARHHVDVYTLSCAEHEFGDIRGMVEKHDVTPFEPLQLLKSPFGRFNQVLRSVDLQRVKHVGRQIAERIDRGGYDVALVHPCKFEQSPSVLRYLRTTPSVYYCHEPRRVLYEAMPSRPYDDDAIGRRRVLNRLDPLPALYRRLLRRVDAVNTRSASTVLVNSRFTADTVARLFGIRAHVSYHGVDVEQFRPYGAERRNFVLSVGSLTPLKGFDFLIRAMARYPGRTRPQLVIASNFQNPPERAYLERLASDLGVEVALRGNVADRDLVELYNQARVVAYAPVREPFGLVPLEAMACATPVVAVREGGIPESVVDERTGLLVERDAEVFGTAVGRLMEDPALARRYGENGRAHVLSAWTWESAVAALEGQLARAAEFRSSSESSVPVLAR